MVITEEEKKRLDERIRQTVKEEVKREIEDKFRLEIPIPKEGISRHGTGYSYDKLNEILEYLINEVVEYRLWQHRTSSTL